MKGRITVISVLVILFLTTACGQTTPTPEAPTAIPTVDKAEIVQAVLAEVKAQLVQPTMTPVPTVATDEIVRAVLRELEPQLSQPTATPVPTVDPDEIVEAVLATFDPEIEGALVKLYQQANPAVVFIVVPPIGTGSGFVYSAEGHIVTNNHVVANGSSYEVVFANGQRARAELVGTDVDSDLAVIKVDQLPDGVEPLSLAEPESIQVGQFVVAIGNPFGEQGSMSLGIISGLGRSIRSERGLTQGGGYSLPQVIQTDAPINPGNSGGPLLNLTGEVVGVNAAIATRTGTNSGVGFSIPVAAIRQIVPSLIEEGAYVYPYMGAAFADEISLDEQETFDLPQTNGAYVLSVTEGGPADEAGLIPADPTTGQGGDLIIRLDDQEINDFADLNTYLVFHTTVGQTIQVTVLRDGEPTLLSLTLGARP